MAERDRDVGARPAADEGFLQRWSRRKAEARAADQTPTEDRGAAAEDPAAPVAESPAPAPGEPAPVAREDLPDIETLDASSDFSVFMRPGVPEHLRTQALRKLWRSDASFSKIDGLLEYGEDYTIQSWPKGVIKTAYRIGRGFMDELEKLGEADAQSATSEEPATGPEPESGPARLAAPAEPAPPEAAAPGESGSPEQTPAQPAKRSAP